MKNTKAGFMAYLPFIVAVITVFTAASVIFGVVFKQTDAIPVFVTFCIIQCIAFILFAFLPQKAKAVPRHASKILMGMTLFVLVGVLGRQNFQIEGFFYMLLVGFFGGAIVHYSIKIVGALISGRSWCSWGCWTAAVLDLLPYNRGTKWSGGKGKHIRYIHFVLSFVIVALAVFVMKHSIQSLNPDQAQSWKDSAATVYWVLGGNILYYASGIILALAMKDNRAFCKYLCPVAVLLKAAGKVSIVRIAPETSGCSGCRMCERVCPASIAVYEYVKKGERIKSTECFMCLNCVALCPEGNLRTTAGIDVSTKEYLSK